MTTISDYPAAAAILDDDRFVVPVPPDPGIPGTVAWLRASVARYSEGQPHHRRRALATGLLDTIDPITLRARAEQRTLDGQSVRAVVCGVLAEALGVDVDLDADIAAAAKAYHPGTGHEADADPSVARLVDVFGGVSDDATAARIGLLVQAYDATAGLIERAGGRELDDVVRNDPPVAVIRRIDAEGNQVHLDVPAINREHVITFGGGRHACPGMEHAMAIAAGVIKGASGPAVTDD